MKKVYIGRDQIVHKDGTITDRVVFSIRKLYLTKQNIIRQPQHPFELWNIYEKDDFKKFRIKLPKRGTIIEAMVDEDKVKQILNQEY